MVLHFHLTSVLIIIWHRISFLVQPRSLLRRLRLDLKKHSHSHRKHDVYPSLPRINSLMCPMKLGLHLQNPKKHADKSKHKVRSRYTSSSSEEDQSSVARHRSSKPSGAQAFGEASDQNQPQHDPDPPTPLITGK